VTRSIFALSIILLLLAPGVASAAPTSAQIMAKMERKMNNFKDLTLKWTLKVKHSSKKHTKVKFKVITRPKGQRLVRMTYPGDVKGMHILVQSKSEMYIYLPAFRKVRRIAGHVRNQGFQGSGFTYDDMSIAQWSPWYNARLTKTTAKHWYMALRVKPGKSAAWARLRLRIRRDIGLIDEIRYINRRGKKVKTQSFTRYKCKSDNSHCNPILIKMVEHTRGNLVSVMKLNGKVRYNKGYSDRTFTVRYLLRSAN
jgi:outer membrane lipoprotein-sorting protein